MEFATGAMSSLLPKLGELLLEEYNLQKSVKKGIEDLRDELLIIEAALKKVSDVPLDQLDPLVKIWANNVRELSYAIEDSLDSFMVRIEGLEPEKPHTFLGFIKKTCKKVTKLKIRREIANDIKDVQIQVKEVKERYDRYKDVINTTSAATKVDPRLLALYNKVSNLVGLDEAIDQLKKMLSKSNDVSPQNTKIISIVGFGGLGKTTLAKAVYDNLYKKFDCGSFVSVGRNPDQKKVLRDILYELDKKKYKHITESEMDERQLIDELRDFLAEKRYLIIIDDIWDTSTWEIIKCALLDSNSESRIISTTRIHEVANKIGGVYNIKPLSNSNSEKLFYSRIFGTGSISPHDQSSELSRKIVRKCGGVPLSIITLASLLVSKPRDDWYKVFDSIGFGHEENEVVENTRKILAFSYYDLPFHLKACLLHLSVYPEDCLIGKNSVIWKWVAEGFVPIKQEIGAFELGQSYYNDLVNKSMIQSINPDDIGMIDGCRVHDIMLDLIRTFSSEVNFVITQDKVQDNTCSSNTSNSARRLAIHGGTVEHMDMGHVRSFYAMDFVDGVLPELLSFKVLRVLALESCDFPAGICRFEHLGMLVQLRYLGLMGTPVAELPADIGHDLKFLQTLDVYGTGIKELPPSVSELAKLMCLRADEDTVMMARIGKLTSLEELELHHVEKVPDFTTDLRKLTQLRVVEIYFDEMEESMHQELVKSVCNLHKIQTLDISSTSDEDMPVDGLEEWASHSNLRQLSLPDMTLPRRPSWMNPSSVPYVSYIWIQVEVLKVRDVKILGRLLSLRFLHLFSERNTVESYTIGSHEFQNLTYLFVTMEIVCGEGALPMLEELECEADAGKDVGLVGNMPFLKQVTYNFCGMNGTEKRVKRAAAAVRHAAETHPNRPKLYIKYEDESDEEEDDKEDDQEEDDGSKEEVSGTDQELNDGTDNISSLTVKKAVMMGRP